MPTRRHRVIYRTTVRENNVCARAMRPPFDWEVTVGLTEPQTPRLEGARRVVQGRPARK